MDDELWERERQFWLAGIGYFEASLAEGCLMAFAPPVGILAGADIAPTLQGVPRWAELDMRDQQQSTHGDTAVLAYRAVANREGQATYRAVCTSTYVKTGQGWRLVQHQQTPE